MGCFDPDLLPSKLAGAFGLIWDGPSIETCTGDLGNYLRINNPHKLSLYIASGLPIIIWRGAAEAGFVEKHRIGISVNSLDELPALLRSMRVADYRSMVQSVTRLAKSVRNGNFLAMAVRTCLEELK